MWKNANANIRRSGRSMRAAASRKMCTFLVLYIFAAIEPIKYDRAQVFHGVDGKIIGRSLPTRERGLNLFQTQMVKLLAYRRRNNHTYIVLYCWQKLKKYQG